MSAMINVFQVSTASYDQHADTLTASVFLTRSYLDPSATIAETDAPEKFEIVLNFADRFSTITDLDKTDLDKTEDYELAYHPSVLQSFAKTFHRAFYKLSCSASPADVFDKEFQFDVPLNA